MMVCIRDGRGTFAAYCRHFHSHSKNRLSNYDLVAILENDFGVPSLRALLWRFVFCAPAVFHIVYMSTIEAAQIAEARVRGVHLQNEMVARDLLIVG